MTWLKLSQPYYEFVKNVSIEFRPGRTQTGLHSYKHWQGLVFSDKNSQKRDITSLFMTVKV